MLKKLGLILACAFPLAAAAQSNLKLIIPIGHTQPVTAIAVSPDDKLLLSGGADNLVYLWETEAGRLLKKYDPHTEPITDIVFSGKGNFFISRQANGLAFLQQIATGAIIDTLAAGQIYPIPGMDAFCWIEQDGAIRSWKVGSPVQTIFKSNIVKSAISPDGSHILVVHTLEHEYDYLPILAEARLIRLSDRKAKPLANVKIALGKQVGFSPDGSSAFVGDDGNTIFEFATSTGVLKRRAPGGSIWINGFSISPEGILAFEGYDIERYWNLKTNAVTFSPPQRKIGFELIAPARYHFGINSETGRREIAASRHEVIVNDKSWELVAPIVARFHQTRKLAVAKGESIEFVDAVTKDVALTLRGSSGIGTPKSLDFSNDNKMLGYTNGQLQLWDLLNGKPVATPADEDTVTSISFVQDKNYLVTGHLGKIKVRDSEKGTLQFELAPPDEYTFGKVSNIQFNKGSNLMLWRDGYGHYIKKWNWSDLSLYQDYKQSHIGIRPVVIQKLTTMSLQAFRSEDKPTNF